MVKYLIGRKYLEVVDELQAADLISHLYHLKLMSGPVWILEIYSRQLTVLPYFVGHYHLINRLHGK